MILLAVLWYGGNAAWNALTPSPVPVIHLCTDDHHSAQGGCSHDVHILDQASADLAYIVTDVPDPNSNSMNGIRIVQDNQDGTTNDVAILSQNNGDSHRVAFSLSDLWGTQGASIVAGSYEIVVDYGTGSLTKYKFTIN